MPSKYTGCTEEKRRACFQEVHPNLLRCCSRFKTPRFITEKLQSFHDDEYFGEYRLACDFDLQEEFLCRNALKRLGVYNEDEDDEMYLLAMAEDGNPIAQLEMADM